jgi:hypothetical protein
MDSPADPYSGTLTIRGTENQWGMGDVKPATRWLNDFLGSARNPWKLAWIDPMVEEYHFNGILMA